MLTMVLNEGSDPSFHVQIFGGPRLFSEGEEIPLSPLQACLLGRVFGCNDPSLPRTFLIALLWPDESPSVARRRLNQLLYSFKKKVGGDGVISATPTEILRADTGVSCDFSDYAEAFRTQAFSTCAELLQRGFASALNGPLTRGCSDWFNESAAELRMALRRGAEQHLRACAREGAWSQGVEAADTVLALPPSDEERLRLVMEVRAQAGFLGEAEDAFHDFFSRQEEKGVEPSSETVTLLNRIKKKAASPPETRPGRRGPGIPEPPLMGRNGERSLLRKTLGNTPAADLRTVLVSGQAGIGKTRLIRESLQGLPLDEHRVFFAESAELEQLIPLNPLIEAFSGAEAREALRRLDEPWRTVLFGVMPAHFPGDGPIPEAPHIQPGSVPRRLFEAFFRLLLVMVEDGPLVFVFEDLQWADETTLSVLEFLFRRWDRGKLQFVFSVRSEEIRKNPVLGQFLENLRGHADLLETPLAELDPPDSEALIQHLSEKPLLGENVSQLRSLAGGNPFFIIELTLEYLAGRLGRVESPQDLVSIPLSIRQVLDRRLSKLSPEAEAVLGSLAVFSRPLDLSALVRITHLTGPECLAGLDQLHLFRLVADRGSEISITHELVRQTVYQSLTATRRAWLHGQVARYLHSHRQSAPPDELAVHFHHAGISEEAVLFATEAADRDEAAGAIPEALRFLRIAREHCTDPETVAALIGRMGHLNYLHQNLEEAAPLLELAAQRFRRQGDIAKALQAEVERIDCLAQRGKHLGQDCLEELQRLKAEASEGGLWEVFHKALDVEAHELDRKGDLERIRGVLALAKANKNRGTLRARCKARAMVALNIYFGSPMEGLQAARRAVQMAKNTSDSELLLHALNRLIVVLHYQGRLHSPEGAKATSEAEARLGTCGDLTLKFNLRLNQAVWHLDVGNLDLARPALFAALEMVRGTSARDAQALAQLNVGELGLAAHDQKLAEDGFRAAQELISHSSPHFFREYAKAGLGLCALQSGELGEARRLESELPPFPEFWTYDPTIVAIFKSRMFRQRRDIPRAVTCLETVRKSVRERLVPTWLRLTLEEARLLRTVDRGKASRLGDEGHEVASALGLEERKGEFDRFRENLRCR